jgi:hypothetical protein
MAVSKQTYDNSFVVAGLKFYASDFLALIAQMQQQSNDIASQCLRKEDSVSQDFTGDVVFTGSTTLPLNAVLASSGTPTGGDAGLVNKKYVDDQVDTSAKLTAGLTTDLGKFDGSASAKVSASNTWEDLDTGLGARAMVFLNVICNNASVVIYLKQKGKGPSDPTKMQANENFSGGGLGYLRGRTSDQEFQTFLLTNGNGKLQIAANSTTALLTITMYAHIMQNN